MLEKLKEQGLNKNERLKSKKDTDFLFKNGDSLFSFPFKLVYNWKKSQIKTQYNS